MKNIIISGASSGIGRASAVRLARAGNRVAVMARRAHLLDELASEIEARHSIFDDGALIELVIRGSLLRDHCGCMLDARPLDIADNKPRQARPGGDFLAVFRLAGRNQSDYQASPQQTSTEIIQQSPVT